MVVEQESDSKLAQTTHTQPSWARYALKQKHHHFDQISIHCCSGSFHNFWCSLRQKFVKMMALPFHCKVSIVQIWEKIEHFIVRYYRCHCHCHHHHHCRHHHHHHLGASWWIMRLEKCQASVYRAIKQSHLHSCHSYHPAGLSANWSGASRRLRIQYHLS